MSIPELPIWYIVIRHARQEDIANVRCDCPTCQGKAGPGYYPMRGSPISAFFDKEQAVRFAVASTTAKERYEAVAVSPVEESRCP